FGLPRAACAGANGPSALAIQYKIVYLFYNVNMKSENTVESAIKGRVDAGQLAGAAALVWRNGKVVDSAAVGRRDLANELPVERHTIFPIRASTKPGTACAA